MIESTVELHPILGEKLIVVTQPLEYIKSTLKEDYSQEIEVLPTKKNVSYAFFMSCKMIERFALKSRATEEELHATMLALVEQKRRELVKRALKIEISRLKSLLDKIPKACSYYDKKGQEYPAYLKANIELKLSRESKLATLKTILENGNF